MYILSWRVHLIYRDIFCPAKRLPINLRCFYKRVLPLLPCHTLILTRNIACIINALSISVIRRVRQFSIQCCQCGIRLDEESYKNVQPFYIQNPLKYSFSPKRVYLQMIWEGKHYIGCWFTFDNDSEPIGQYFRRVGKAQSWIKWPK